MSPQSAHAQTIARLTATMTVINRVHMKIGDKWYVLRDFKFAGYTAFRETLHHLDGSTPVFALQIAL